MTNREPKRWLIVLGGVVGAGVALLGILLGRTVANLTGGEHAAGPGHAVESQEH